MGMPLVIVSAILLSIITTAVSFPYGGSKFLEKCSSNADCAEGLFCSSCLLQFQGSRCVRSSTTNPFKLLNTSLPFNKYAYLTTHNSFAIGNGPLPEGTPRVTFINQEDSITQQLYNGVRALMLDTYDYKGDVWLCHSFKGKCHDFTAFEPAINAFKEVETFLSANPSEIVTLILEDYVEARNGLTKVFKASGLMKYWFPVSSMPQNGQDWPLVKDMISKNYRLIVFGSKMQKEKSEGIAYQWKYMRSEGGGSFQAVDMLNGKLLCGCDDVHTCEIRYAEEVLIFCIDNTICLVSSNYVHAFSAAWIVMQKRSIIKARWGEGIN
ncbi:hypothetical protein RIF29_16097 [Crotalaria pallida]|uniref:Uncharacterized protein n=1 Tax=Crotalaria pallida TaxID=3830 RepID=A0AAN9IJK1_CROPI